MALTATEVKVAADGHIHTGATDAAPPADVTTPISAVTYSELGYASEDGVTLSPNIELEDINAWQSAAPVRRIVTGSGLEIGFTLIQTNQSNIELYTAGVLDANADTINVSRNPTAVEKSLVIEWIDGGSTYRLYVARAILASVGEVTLARGEAVSYEMTWQAVPSGTNSATPLYSILTPVVA